MPKLLFLIFLSVFANLVNAQTSTAHVPLTEEFGKVDQSDFELKACDFEKEANAMVLFDVGDAYYTERGAVVDYHKRIKIFNEKGNADANIRLEYISIYSYEYITGLEAETINLVNGKPEITKVDKRQIFTQRMDVIRNVITFAFPNVKPGSIIEFKYRLNTVLLNIPKWYFQSDIPERYNQITISIPDHLIYRVQIHQNQSFEKDISTAGTSGVNKHVYAMTNVLSFRDEPFMSSRPDNVQSAGFQITGSNTGYNYFFDSWEKVGKYLINDKYFGYEMNMALSGQKEILKNVKSTSSEDQKIALLFNKVKNDLKWNGINTWDVQSGINKAWELKTGNATEINLILHSLLTSAGIEAYPFLLSTHKNGKVNPIYASPNQFNRAVVYVAGKNGKNYILDASNKYNRYNETPGDLLNSFGLIVDKEHGIFKTMYIENKIPVKNVVFVNAEIKSDGSIEGTAQKSNDSYVRTEIIEKYQKLGDQKYKEYLTRGDNNIKISELSLENIDADSLPLKQKIKFKVTSAEADNDYIYLKTTIFSDFDKNPFIAEKRLSDVDFGYLNSYSITGVYKIPPGYKTDGLPRSVSLTMPDKSISFMRLVDEQDGLISVRYTIDYQKSMFFKENYQDFREFYKKMYEFLDQQIVLKKL